MVSGSSWRGTMKSSAAYCGAAAPSRGSRVMPVVTNLKPCAGSLKPAKSWLRCPRRLRPGLALRQWRWRCVPTLRDQGAQGSALVAFLGVPEEEVSGQEFTHHQLLEDYAKPLGNGNNMFISVSAAGDLASRPPDIGPS